MTTPPAECLKTLFVTLMSLTTDQGIRPNSVRTLKTRANPRWSPPTQLFSKTLLSIVMRWAVFNSRWFLTQMGVPAYDALPGLQLSGLKKLLFWTTMSDGIRP